MQTRVNDIMVSAYQLICRVARNLTEFFVGVQDDAFFIGNGANNIAILLPFNVLEQ